jgi:hypothetical protein
VKHAAAAVVPADLIDLRQVTRAIHPSNWWRSMLLLVELLADLPASAEPSWPTRIVLLYDKRWVGGEAQSSPGPGGCWNVGTATDRECPITAIVA